MTLSTTRPLRLLRWSAAEVDPGSGEAPRTYADPHADAPPVAYHERFWESPVTALDFDVTSLIASWTARTPGTSWLEVAVRGGAVSADSDWLVVGRWAETTEEIHRTSVPGQASAGARVATDEVLVEPQMHWRHVQLRVSLLRRAGEHPDEPAGVESLTLLVSGADDEAPTTSYPSGTELQPAESVRVLDVPTYSQQLHRDLLPELGGGGQNWCSPTSVSMVVDHWGAGPVATAAEAVPYAARHTYDFAYTGTGNWPFNAAYAGRFGLDAFVTRLHSLEEAAHFIAAGIPLVLGIAFTKEQLDGAGYATDGHLVVLVGFDENGDVIVNDPASHQRRSDDDVPTTYRREQFAQSWLRRSSGIAYVIKPPHVPLPPAPSGAAW